MFLTLRNQVSRRHTDRLSGHRAAAASRMAVSGRVRGSIHSQTSRPTRRSWAGLTTAGTSAALWYAGIRRAADPGSREPGLVERPVVARLVVLRRRTPSTCARRAARTSSVAHRRWLQPTRRHAAPSTRRRPGRARPSRPASGAPARSAASTIALEPKWCRASPLPRGSSAPNATKTTGSLGSSERRHPGQLEDHRDAGCVVLGSRRLRHRVEVRTDDEVRLARVEARRGGDHVADSAGRNVDPPGVAGRCPEPLPSYVVPECLELAPAPSSPPRRTPATSRAADRCRWRGAARSASPQPS